MSGKAKRSYPTNRADHLMAQADRARNMAAAASIDFIADLYKVHAQACEDNAEARRRKRGKKDATAEI